MSHLNLYVDGEALDPEWWRHFWSDVSQLHAQGRLHALVHNLLARQGYVGPATTSVPRMDELREGLCGLIALKPAGGGHGPGACGAVPLEMAPALDDTRWHSQHPPNFPRAAAAIYWNIRSAGAAGIRDWMQHDYTGSKKEEIWVDLWTAASSAKRAH